MSDGAPSVLLALALLAYQSTRVLAQLAAARILGPAEYGAWVVGATILSYVAFIQLGTSSALPRLVPEKLARGFGPLDPQAAVRVARASESTRRGRSRERRMGRTGSTSISMN